jgi:hypothetical protein
MRTIRPRLCLIDQYCIGISLEDIDDENLSDPGQGN